MKLLLTSLLAAAVSTVQAGTPQEIMLLTSWDGALERFWRNDRTSGVRFSGKNPADSNQKWLVDTSANSIRTSDNFCVTAAWSPGEAFPNDLIVLLTSCNGGDNQRWVYTKGDRTFQVTLRGSQGSRTYCLDADKATGSNIHGWSCSPSNAPNANQQWTLFYPGYQIKAGGKCLALGQANHEDEPIRLAECDNNPLQMWKYDFEKAQLRLGDPSSTTCVDSYPVGEGGTVHMWWCDNTNENQQIEFTARANVNGDLQGHFFVRDTENYLTVSSDGSKLVSSTPFKEGVTTLFTMHTDLPSDLCGSKTCKNKGACFYGRCRCLDGTMGDDCGTVGTSVRIRATNGRFLTVADSGYALEYALPDSDKRQQVWYHFPGTDMLKIKRRRMCLQANGDKAELATCRPSEANQKWIFDLATGRLQLKNTNRCLDVDVRSTTNRAARMQDCVASTNANQVWEEISPDAVAVNSDMFAALIRHRASPSLCWTLQNSQVVTAACQAAANQLWSFNDAYTGVGSLCNGDSCAVAKTGTDAKPLVTLSSYDGQRLDQRFEYESGTGQIRMANTDQCVAKTSDGSNRLLMVTCAASDPAQTWYLAKLDKCLSDDFLTLKTRCVMGECKFGRCQCQPGFQGADCSYDSCSLLQCNNGGTCSLGKCKCKDGYDGMFCDTFTKCKGVKCLNGGKCGNDGKCQCPVGYSGARCHVKHPRVFLRVLEHQAIGLEGGLVTTVLPDVRKKEHQWVWDSFKNMLSSFASPNMCLEQISSTDLGTGMCNETKAQQKWMYFPATGMLLTHSDTELFIVGLEESVTGRYRPRLGATFGHTNGMDLRFVEMDRLDLPGFPIRSNDRSKCLTATTNGTVSAAFCIEDDESQQWEYHPQNGVLKLPRLGAPLCLSVNGASVAAVKCNGEDSAQQFNFDFATKRFQNRKTRACLVLGDSSLTTGECSSNAPANQVLRTPFRGFCDTINMCEGGGVCSFGRCSCAPDRSGGFCEVAVNAQ